MRCARMYSQIKMCLEGERVGEIQKWRVANNHIYIVLICSDIALEQQIKNKNYTKYF